MLQEQEWDSYIIRNVNVWNAKGVKSHHDVQVLKGVVTAIRPTETATPEGVRIIQAENLALLPAGVDLYAQTRTSGTNRQTRERLFGAALRGGWGFLLSTPQGVPVLDSPESVSYYRNEMKEWEIRYGLRVGALAAISRGLKGTDPVDFRALKDAGVLAYSDVPRGVGNAALMREALRHSDSSGMPVLQQAEMPGHNGQLADSVVQRALQLKPYTETPEYVIATRDIETLRSLPRARYLIMPISSEKTLQAIHEAKHDRLNISCATTAHHLLFSSQQLREGNYGFKVSPPIRGEEDRHALRQAAVDGLIDFVVSQHLIFEQPTTGWDAAPFGTSALEMTLRVLLTLCQENLLTPQRVVQLFSTQPAKFLKLDAEYGAIESGRPFRAVLVDPKAPKQEVREKELICAAKCCFVGAKLGGRVKGTFLGRKSFMWE